MLFKFLKEFFLRRPDCKKIGKKVRKKCLKNTLKKKIQKIAKTRFLKFLKKKNLRRPDCKKKSKKHVFLKMWYLVPLKKKCPLFA